MQQRIHRDRLVDLIEEARKEAEACGNKEDYTGYNRCLDQMESGYRMMCCLGPETRQEVVALLRRVAAEVLRRKGEWMAWSDRWAVMREPAEKTEAEVENKLSAYGRIGDQKQILIRAIASKF